MQKIWICGSKGQIGSALTRLINTLEYELTDTDVDDVDVTKIDEVMRFGEMYRPDIIINCSGMTDTEACEKNPKQAYLVNAIGARNLSIIAQKVQAKMVQISSDDVFDGDTDKPYTEYDVLNPKTVYGKSKAAGEAYVKEFTSKHFIIRSSWVYGKGNNFVKSVLDKIKSGEALNIADNHIGSPTSATQLARFILQLIKTNEYGTFHATNKGTCSRYEFAKEIEKIIGKDANITGVPIEQSDFSTVRPKFAVLDNFVLDMLQVYEFPTWQESLAEYFQGKK